jgi:plastocyanin
VLNNVCINIKYKNMKKTLLIVLFAVLYSGCSKSTDYGTNVNPPPSTTTRHIISASGTSFSPNTVTAKVGDTVDFVWGSGTHTTTSTSVPTGAAGWNSPLSSTATTFRYIITTAGSYSYQCNIHVSMGMTGSISVTAN